MTHDIPLRLNRYYLLRNNKHQFFYIKVDALGGRSATCSIISATGGQCESGVKFRRGWLEDNLQMEIQNEARIVELKLCGLV